MTSKFPAPVVQLAETGEKEDKNSLHPTPAEVTNLRESTIYHCNYEFCSSQFEERELLEQHSFSAHPHPGEKQPNNCIPTGRGSADFLIEVIDISSDSSDNDNDNISATTDQDLDKSQIDENHKGIKPYRCNLCFKAFVQQPNLENHIRIHTKEKPYNCPMCPKSFAQLTQVNNHRRIHTGEKPFLCKKCPMKFTQKSNLNQHMLLHSTSNVNTTCPICTRTFQNAIYFEKHVRNHKKALKCLTCGRIYMKKSSLKKHIKDFH